MISSDFLTRNFLNIEEIEKVIAQSEIEYVSFDIFDTLIYRPAIFPSDILYIVDSELKRKGINDFLKYRLNAEERLKNPNANFDDIYSFIQKTHRVPDEQIKLMKGIELAVEFKANRAREDLKRIYNFALEHGKKVIAISDMYLSEGFLKKVLIKNGYANLDRIFVSNVYKKRKDTGELYDEVLKVLNVSASSVVHIGDSYHSDVEIPAKKGIITLYYPSFLCLALQYNDFNRIYAEPHVSNDPFSRLLLGFVLGDYFSNYGNQVTKKLFEDFDDLILIGLIPVVFMVSLYILNNHEIQKNYKQVFFASRDGYRVNQVYSFLSERLKALPSKYLYAGRRAYSILDPGIKTFLDYYLLVAKKNKNLSFNNFVENYIFDESLRGFISSNEEGNLSFTLHDEKSCRAVIRRHSDKLNLYLKKAVRNASEYYRSELTGGDASHKRAVVFDCGYSGSISYCLSKGLKDVLVDKIYIWGSPENDEKDLKQGTRTFQIISSDVPVNSLHLIFEELFSPLEGTVLGFDSSFKPVFEKCSFSAEMKRLFGKIDHFVTCQTAKLYETFGSYLKDFQIKDRTKFLDILNYSITQSRFGEKRLLSPVCFPDFSMLNDANTSLMNKIDRAVAHANLGTTLQVTGLNDFVYTYPPANPALNLNNKKVGIHLHCYNFHLLQEIVVLLYQFPVDFDLYVTTPDEANVSSIKVQLGIIPRLKDLNVIVVPNRGRDVAPWLISTRDVQAKYDYFCHVHTKVSKHCSFGDNWRRYLYSNLLESKAVTDILTLFESDPKIGCIYPYRYFELAYFEVENFIKPLGMFREENLIDSLLKKFSINKQISNSDIDYSAGTMYWYRPRAFRQLFEYNFTFEDFPAEPIGVGGTLAHAIERLPTFLSRYNFFLNVPYSRYRIFDFKDTVFGNNGVLNNCMISPDFYFNSVLKAKGSAIKKLVKKYYKYKFLNLIFFNSVPAFRKRFKNLRNRLSNH